LKIKTIIKKIKPVVSVVCILSGMLIFPLLGENITHAWEGISLALIAIGILVYIPWTLGSESKT